MAVCVTCGHDNVTGAKFCARCGQSLTLACPACGNAYEIGDLFCVDAGEALEQREAEPVERRDGEGCVAALQARGEPTRDRVLRAMVPISVRADTERAALGNRVSSMFVDLPVGEMGAKRRLRQITDADLVTEAALPDNLSPPDRISLCRLLLNLAAQRRDPANVHTIDTGYCAHSFAPNN